MKYRCAIFHLNIWQIRSNIANWICFCIILIDFENRLHHLSTNTLLWSIHLHQWIFCLKTAIKNLLCVTLTVHYLLVNAQSSWGPTACSSSSSLSYAQHLYCFIFSLLEDFSISMSPLSWLFFCLSCFMVQHASSTKTDAA